MTKLRSEYIKACGDDSQLFLQLSPSPDGRQCGEGETGSNDDHPGLSRAARPRLDDDLHARASAGRGWPGSAPDPLNSLSG